VARKAFKDGFKKDKGEARFRRSEVLHGSFNWANARTKLSENKLLLSKRMGNIKIIREREFPIFTATFTIEFEKEIKNIETSYIKNPTILGMDTNNGHLNFSDKTVKKYKRSLNLNELKKLKNKKAKKLVKEIEKLDYLQKKQSKRLEKAKKTKKKVSKNFYKTQYKINKIQTKHKNRRKNLLDGLSNEILSKTFDVLSIEELDVKSMTSKKNDNKNKIMPKQKVKQMRKNILNFSYSILHNMLLYKAPLTDKLVIQIEPKLTTSSCCKCGSIQKLELSDRVFNCLECDNIIDRDENSAINIRNRGINFVEALTVSCLSA
jgi:putative transposase